MNHISSPRTDDSAIEQEIKAKGLTAPRVTPQDLQNAIARHFYFTAGQAAEFLGRTPKADDPEHLLTFCVIVMQNGFTVTGESACASPENFDEEVGRKVAFENAKNKMWPLLGYALKEKLA